jgi:UDP-N-acetylmuramoyl-tripeptide--D-alanyl-D-alanine ligase
MMHLSEAVVALQGHLVMAGEANEYFINVSTDTRSLATGDLFIALRGENFDGHSFVHRALAEGAVAAVVDETWLEQQKDDNCTALPLIVVDDTRLALGRLAAAWRQRFTLPLIGITGSNGKTTVKEMCAAILRQQAVQDGFDPNSAVLATLGNLNNDIGMPMMLLKLRPNHRAAVIEMGMNHPGEIDYLTRLAAPTVALVNNAQRAHLEGLGSLAGVARAKGEIFNGLTTTGTAIINVDDDQAALWLAQAHQQHLQVLRFGLTTEADVHAAYRITALGSQLSLMTPQGGCELELQLPGVHNVRNALAAAAATLAAGASLAAVQTGLNTYRGIKGRLQHRPCLNGAHLIDDSYNANPDSMRAAIDVLATLPGKKILVLGDMGEVGAQSGQCHDEIGGYAKSMGIDVLLALGEHAAAAVRNFGTGATHFADAAALIAVLIPQLDAQTAVLIKGSRFMRMERIADALEAH